MQMRGERGLRRRQFGLQIGRVQSVTLAELNTSTGGVDPLNRMRPRRNAQRECPSSTVTRETRRKPDDYPVRYLAMWSLIPSDVALRALSSFVCQTTLEPCSRARTADPSHGLHKARSATRVLRRVGGAGFAFPFTTLSNRRSRNGGRSVTSIHGEAARRFIRGDGCLLRRRCDSSGCGVSTNVELVAARGR